MTPLYVLVNCYGEPLSGYAPMTKTEAEAAVRREWTLGFEVYVKEVK